MDTTPDDGYVESFEVDSSTSTSIQVKWTVQGAVVAFIDYFRVHYQKVASTYVQYGPKLPATTNVYEIRNLVADTYYKVNNTAYTVDPAFFFFYNRLETMKLKMLSICPEF